MEFGDLNTPSFWTLLLAAGGVIWNRLAGGQPLVSLTKNYITVNGDNNNINCPPDPKPEVPPKRLPPEKERDDGRN